MRNKTTLLSLLFATAIIFGLTTGSVLAHDEHAAEKKLPPHERPAPDHPAGGKSGSLAEAATNPVSNLMQFRLQDSFNWENHNSSGSSNVATFQGVVPVSLPWEDVPMLITRMTIPYVTTPRLEAPINDRFRGLGDSEFLALFLPKTKMKKQVVGLGPTLVLPTAGDNLFTGSGKWQLGPSGVYLNLATPKLQWGLLAFQLWDIADGAGQDRGSVSQLNLEPILTKHFDGGWYVALPDAPQTFDFIKDKWSLALGGQVGRVIKVGKQPLQLFGEVYYNPIDDAGPTAEWTFKFNISFLIPE